MSETLHRAQPPLDFIPPHFNPKVLWLTKTLLPAWMQWRSSIDALEVAGAETLVELFRQFQADRVRFLIAFRHPSPNDAYCLMHLLWHHLPRMAKATGPSLTDTPHAHFVYDRGIPLWAGKGVGWLYSNLGGTPILRGKIDRSGLKSIRHLFANGHFPMAAAPEGGNNGHTEIISPLEPGVAQFGFWCVEDLRQQQRSERVLIVPLGIRYRYCQAPWSALEALLTTLETEAGLSPAASDGISPAIGTAGETALSAQQLYPRLVRLGEHLLGLMERYYAKFFEAAFDPLDAPQGKNETPGENLAIRLNQLLDTALQVAESFFHLSGKGSVIDRCRRIEQAGWDWIYRDDLGAQSQWSAVERGLADRIAEEATLRMWHMRLVESFVAVTGDYVKQKPTVERFAETLFLLRDTIVLIKGESPFPRPVLGKQMAYLSVGAPLSVSDRWSDYKQNRRQAISTLTADLQDSMQALL